MIVLDKEKDEKPRRDLVPDFAPYGSITDGDWICGRCGESITGCALCAGEIRHVVKLKQTWGAP